MGVVKRGCGVLVLVVVVVAAVVVMVLVVVDGLASSSGFCSRV